MPNYDLGTAKGKIVVDSSEASKGLDSAGRSIDDLDKKAGTSTGGLQKLEKGLLAVGVAGVAAFGFAIKKAADFEESLSGIKAVSGATEAQMETLRKKALQLGADTAFSAGEAALAMEELSKSGLSVEEILNGAADATVNLAAAGEVSLPEAATIAANAMNQFGLSAEELPHVADLIAGAANASAISVSDFGMSMAQAGASANLTGLSFDDMALAITAMGNAGIKGSDAGTSLKTFLSGLQPVTEKQIALFDSLGLSMEGNATGANTLGNNFFDAQGKVKPMEDIAGTLATALTGMSDAQKAATLETLFGSDAVRAAAIIAETGAAGFDELASSMGSISAADVAATRLDNFNGSMEQLKGSMETAAIGVGTLFLPALRGIADRATEWVNKFAEMDEGTQKWIVGVGAGVVAAAGLTGGIGLFVHQAAPVVSGIGSMIGALSGLASSLFITTTSLEGVAVAQLSAFGWIALVVVAIAALVAGIIYAYNHFDAFRDVIDTIGRAIKDFALLVWGYINDTIIPALKSMAAFFMDEVLPVIKDVVGFVIDYWTTLIGVIIDVVKKIIEVVGGVVDFFMNDFVPGVKSAWESVQKAIQPFVSWFDKNVVSTLGALIDLLVAIFDKVLWFTENVLIPGLQIAWDVLSAIVSKALDILVPIIQVAFDIIVGILTVAWDVIAVIFQTAADIIMGIVSFFVGAFQKFWDLFGDNIMAAAELAWNFIKMIIETVLGIIRGIAQVFTGIFTGDWDKFLQGLKTLWDTLWNVVKVILETIVGVIKLIIENFIDTISLILSVGWDAIKLVVETVWNVIKGIIEAIWIVISAIVGTAINLVKSTIEIALGIIQGIWDTIWNAISTTISVIWDTIKSVISLAIGIVKGVIDTVLGTIQGAWDLVWGAISSTISTVWDGIKSAISTAIGIVKDTITTVTDAISSAWDSVWGAVSGAVTGAWTTIKDTVQMIVDFIWGKVQWVLEKVQGAWDALTSLLSSDVEGKVGIGLPPGGARGGIFTQETIMRIGEAGREVLIPMEDKNRAMWLMNASGLSKMFLENYDPVGSPPSMGTGMDLQSRTSSAAPTSVTGVSIGEANFYDGIDLAMLMTQAEFAVQGAKL